MPTLRWIVLTSLAGRFLRNGLVGLLGKNVKKYFDAGWH